jgi:hypothetical protein
MIKFDDQIFCEYGHKGEVIELAMTMYSIDRRNLGLSGIVDSVASKKDSQSEHVHGENCNHDHEHK